MSDEEKVVPFGRRRPDPARVAEFAATARKLQEERESSADVVADLLRTTPRESWSRLAENAALRNSGAIARLGKEVSSRLEKQPQDALAISSIATTLAETLPADAYPAVVLAQIRSHAWKDRAQALCYLARYDEAFAAIERAESLLVSFGTLAHDRAVVRFVKAMACQYVRRLGEARTLLDNCIAVFRDHGDARLSLFCGIASGCLDYAGGDAAKARKRFESLLEVASEVDHASEARLHQNIALCSVDLADYETAQRHVVQAAALFTALDMPVEAIRADAIHARALVLTGDTRTGLMQLLNVRRRFLRLDLIEEAGIYGLDAVEALLTLGDSGRATRLAGEIVHQFTNARLSERAVSAVAYLREAVSAHRATAATAQSVRKYVLDLRTNPNLEFAVN